jgi:hypothetical protein
VLLILLALSLSLCICDISCSHGCLRVRIVHSRLSLRFSPYVY